MLDRPFDLRTPFWATRSFRWLVIAGVMALAAMGILVFEVMPAMQSAPPKKEAPPPTPIPPQERAVRFDGVLAAVKDGTEPDKNEKAFTYLVRHLSTLDAAKLHAQAKEVTYGYFSKYADDLRGTTVRLIGLLEADDAERLDKPIGNIEWVHRVIVTDLSGEDGYMFYLIDTPPNLPHRQVVSIEGIFLKNTTYETVKYETVKDKDNKPIQQPIKKTAPLLLGRQMAAWHEGSSAIEGLDVKWIIAGLGAASVLMILLLSIPVIRQARRGRSSSLPVSRIP